MSGSRAYQRFLAELKRRHVFKVAAMYGAVSFVVIQAADVIFPRIPLPDWTVSLVVWLAVLGLPVAIVLAWALEKTPEGVKRTENAKPGELETIAAAPVSRRWPIGLAALAGVGLVALSGWWAFSGRLRATATSYESIAVLPFTNISDDKQNEFFADGLAEELLNALAGVEGLRVAARTSAFAFKGTDMDIRRIADSLGVQTVLEGSVRRSDAEGTLRITAQLIEAEEGFHLWSDSYDTRIEDVFAVQDEIATSIVQALLPRLKPEATDSLYRGGSTDLAAHDEYLLGRQKWVTRDRDALREAIDHFRSAIARDSSFALARSGLADAIDGLAYRDPAALDLLPEARAAAQRAILLDPGLAEGWASVGVLASDFDSDWTTAEIALRRAVDLKPSYATANVWLADLLRSRGKIKQAVLFNELAVRLDPLAPVMRQSYAATLAALGRDEEALEEYQKFLELSSDGTRNVPVILTQIIVSHDRYGLSEADLLEATETLLRLSGSPDSQAARWLTDALLTGNRRSEVDEVIKALPDETGFAQALLWIGVGDTARAMDEVERQFELGAGQNITLGFLAEFDPLRGNIRFQSIINALGIPNGYDPDADPGLN